MNNKDNLSWGEKFSIAWEVFLNIYAWAGMIFYSLAALFVLGAFIYFFISGKLF